LENSGAIWQITLTVNKKSDENDELSMTASCGSFCHAFDNRSLLYISSIEEKL